MLGVVSAPHAIFRRSRHEAGLLPEIMKSKEGRGQNSKHAWGQI